MSKKAKIFIAACAVAAVACVAVIVYFLVFAPRSANDNVIINPDVIVYEEGESPFQILSSDDTSITVSETADIKEGSIIASDVTDAAPSGLLRRVTALNTNSDGTVHLETTPAALTEAIDYCDVHQTITFNDNGTYTLEQDDTGGNTPFSIEKAYADEIGFMFTQDYGAIQFMAGLKLELDLKIENGEIKTELALCVNSELDVSAFSKSFEKDLPVPPLRPVTFFIGPVPIVIDHSISATLEGDAEIVGSGVNLAVIYDRKMGYSYSSEKGLSPVDEDNSRIELQTSYSDRNIIYADLVLRLPMEYEAYLYGLAGPSIQVSIDASYESLLEIAKPGEDVSEAYQPAGTDKSFFGETRFKVTLPIEGHFRLQIPDFNPFTAAKSAKSKKKAKSSKSSSSKSSSSSISSYDDDDDGDDDDDDNTLADFELFNTGDAITLIDDYHVYGHVPPKPSFTDEDLEGSPIVQVTGNPDGTDVMVVLDVSGSMSGDRINAAKEATLEFVDRVLGEGIRVGIVTYSSKAEILSDLIGNARFLKSQAEGIFSGGGTDIESGLRLAFDALDASDASKKVLILMSDGEPTTGLEGDDLIDYALAEKGEENASGSIRVYTLGFNEGSEGLVLLRGMADENRHYEIKNSEDLEPFFTDIADEINGIHSIYNEIACPVDVKVTYQGETLNSAEGERNDRTSFGSITYEDEYDENGNVIEEDAIKIVRLREGANYKLELTGTGYGTMTYTVSYMDDDGNYVDTRVFSDVPVTSNMKAVTYIDSSEDSLLKVDVEGDGRFDQAYRAEANSEGVLVDNSFFTLLILWALLAVAILVSALVVFLTIRGAMEQRR